MSKAARGLETLPERAEPTAVVVEDDQIVVTLLEHLLSRRGFDVRVALDGRQAQISSTPYRRPLWYCLM